MTFGIKRVPHIYKIPRNCLLVLVLLVDGCAAPFHGSPRVGAGPPDDTVSLFEPATVIQDHWQHMPFGRKTEYRLVHFDGKLALRAIGRESASGIIRRIRVDPDRCPILNWTWRVEQLQSTADIRAKDADDVAASLYLLFGDPGFLSDPNAVPTLRYVWTTDRVERNAVIDNPYMTGIVRNIVVRTGSEQLGKWMTESRNIVADFELAFGEKPKDPIEAFALFTDNDQTKQAVKAYYAEARLLCTKRTETLR